MSIIGTVALLPAAESLATVARAVSEAIATAINCKLRSFQNKGTLYLAYDLVGLQDVQDLP